MSSTSRPPPVLAPVFTIADLPSLLERMGIPNPAEKRKYFQLPALHQTLQWKKKMIEKMLSVDGKKAEALQKFFEFIWNAQKSRSTEHRASNQEQSSMKAVPPPTSATPVKKTPLPDVDMDAAPPTTSPPLTNISENLFPSERLFYSTVCPRGLEIMDLKWTPSSYVYRSGCKEVEDLRGMSGWVQRSGCEAAVQVLREENWERLVLRKKEGLIEKGCSPEDAKTLIPIFEYIKKNGLLPLELISRAPVPPPSKDALSPVTTAPDPPPANTTPALPRRTLTWFQMPNDCNSLTHGELEFYETICENGNEYVEGMESLWGLRMVKAWLEKAGVTDTTLLTKFSMIQWQYLVKYGETELLASYCPPSQIPLLLSIFTFIIYYGVLPDELRPPPIEDDKPRPKSILKKAAYYTRPVTSRRVHFEAGKKDKTRWKTIDMHQPTNQHETTKRERETERRRLFGNGKAFGVPEKEKMLIATKTDLNESVLKCWIEVEGGRGWAFQELQVMRAWHPDSLPADRSHHTAAFIACRHKSHFRVVFRPSQLRKRYLAMSRDGFAYDSWHLRYFIDGRTCGTHFMGPDSINRVRTKDGKREGDAIQPLVFDAPKFTNVDPTSRSASSNISRAGHGGTIRVEIRRARRILQSESETWNGNGYVPSTRPPPLEAKMETSVFEGERGKISSTVKFDSSEGKGMDNANLLPVEYYEEDVTVPLHTFTFVYRTVEWLEANGVIGNGKLSETAKQVILDLQGITIPQHHNNLRRRVDLLRTLDPTAPIFEPVQNNGKAEDKGAGEKSDEPVWKLKMAPNLKKRAREDDEEDIADQVASKKVKKSDIIELDHPADEEQDQDETQVDPPMSNQARNNLIPTAPQGDIDDDNSGSDRGSHTGDFNLELTAEEMQARQLDAQGHDGDGNGEETLPAAQTTVAQTVAMSASASDDKITARPLERAADEQEDDGMGVEMQHADKKGRLAEA